MRDWTREKLTDPPDDADRFAMFDPDETVPAVCPDCGGFVCMCLEEEPEHLRNYTPAVRTVRTDYV